MLADDRHPEVCSPSAGIGAATILDGKRGAIEASGVGEVAGLREEGFPVCVREAACVPVGAGVLAAVVEEADVVVFVLEGEDLGFDEGVEGGEELLEGGGNGEVHCFGGHGVEELGWGGMDGWFSGEAL